MHEYSIVQSLLERVEGEARRHGATSVQRLHLRIGALSGVEIELLANAFALFRERSLCAGAELAIESVPARWICPHCDRDIAPGEILRCPACTAPARLAGGDEIILERIEMEVP
jgi:hydrogenase nickel incorporation protein HypA/HybF